MVPKIRTSIVKCVKSFSYAFRGLLHVAKNENNFNYHFFASVIAIIAGFAFNLDLWEWCIILLLIGVVLLSEVFNTAIEKLVDLAEPEFNPKAGLIKDIAAGGVLVASITAAIIGVLIFLNKLV